MKHLTTFLFCLLAFHLPLKAVSDNPDTLMVAKDGSGQYQTLGEALENCRVLMDYHKVIFLKKGVYKEKVIIPSGLQHIEIVGEDADSTIIMGSDYANLFLPGTTTKMGTFKTYTLRIDGSHIILRNLTIENNAPQLGQAVALHTEGDYIQCIHCHLIGNQDTVYTGREGSLLYFSDCYIEGTTDFIFGSATAWFENCEIHSKANSYITAASTPKESPFGYVFNHCKLTASEGITKVFLGRPWRPYSATIYMNCIMDRHICPEGWDNWRNKENEKTVRYAEYNNSGEGSCTDKRVAWCRQLTKKEAQRVTIKNVFTTSHCWTW